MGIACIIFAIIFYNYGRSQDKLIAMVGPEHARSAEWAYVVAVICLIVGIILIIRKSNKTQLAQTSLENSVNWREAQNRINSVKSAFEHLDVITLQSDGEITKTGCLGIPGIALDDHCWAIKTLLSVNNQFALRHVYDSVNIPCPYANEWEEMLDNQVGIWINIERIGDSTRCVFRCSLPIPREITMDTIKRHLSI